MTLAAALAHGTVSFLPTPPAIEPIGTPGHGCHAGAGHGPSFDRRAFGDLCDPCWTAVKRLLSRRTGTVAP